LDSSALGDEAGGYLGGSSAFAKCPLAVATYEASSVPG
jgi:hypothetical protein